MCRPADYDEEDVVLRRLEELVLSVRNGRFPQLGDSDDLWRLLFLITSRKSLTALAFNVASKRDASREIGKGAKLANETSQTSWFFPMNPTPLWVAESERAVIAIAREFAE